MQYIKIKIKEDGYKGCIKNKKFSSFLRSTHKIQTLKANIYKFPNIKKKIYELPFGSKIKVLEKKSDIISNNLDLNRLIPLQGKSKISNQT